MATHEAIAQAVERYYPSLAASWVDETAGSGYRPLPSGALQSYGQCMATECVLLDQLHEDFPEENGHLQLAWGNVWDTRQPGGLIIGNHLWISRKPPPIQEPGVIDAAAKQSETSPLRSYEVATYAQLIARNVAYVAFKMFDSVEALLALPAGEDHRAQHMQQIQVLQDRFNRLRTDRS